MVCLGKHSRKLSGSRLNNISDFHPCRVRFFMDSADLQSSDGNIAVTARCFSWLITMVKSKRLEKPKYAAWVW